MSELLSKSFLNAGVCPALLILLCLGCNEAQITKYTDEAIKNSPELQELEKVCTQIPLPQDFQFVRKGGIDDQRIMLTYLYYSETEYGKATAVWINYFNENGWKKVKEDNSYPKVIEFRNDRFRVAIQHGGIGKTSNYGISCEKLSIYSDKIARNRKR